MAYSIHRRTSASTKLSYLSNIPFIPRDAPITRISLMIHGWTCRATHYIPLITLLSEQGFNAENGYLYIAVDLPGHGESSSSILPEPEKGGMIELMMTFCEDVLSSLQAAGTAHPNKAIPLDFYVHSMGTRIAFGLSSFLSDTTFNNVRLCPSHFILLEGSYTSPDPPPPLNPGLLQAKADSFKQHALLTMYKYFGAHSSDSFKSEMKEFVAGLNFAYVLRVAHWYNSFDCMMPLLLDTFSLKNYQLQAEGKEPIKVLNIQGQESGPGGRHSIKKGDVTVHMKLLRGHVAPWLQEYVIEDTSHFVHVDDVEEVAAQLVHLQGTVGVEQSRL